MASKSLGMLGKRRDLGFSAAGKGDKNRSTSPEYLANLAQVFPKPRPGPVEGFSPTRKLGVVRKVYR